MHGLIQTMKTSSVASEMIEQMLAEALGSALSETTGESVQVRRTAGQELPTGSPTWFLSGCSEFPGAGLLLGGSREAWFSTGRKPLARAGSVEADDETALSAARDIVTKALNTFASALSVKLNRGISFESLRELTAAPDSISLDALTGLELEFHDESRVALNLIVDPKLTAALCTDEKVMTSSPAGSPVNTKNLDLLLDVEMPVSVSFGRAQLPLKYLIKLTTGSIVELGRSVSEPVDIIVNNTVIARGEVVVVGGNFGVRIKEILSKQDRLRTLT